MSSHILNLLAYHSTGGPFVLRLWAYLSPQVRSPPCSNPASCLSLKPIFTDVEPARGCSCLTSILRWRLPFWQLTGKKIWLETAETRALLARLKPALHLLFSVYRCVSLDSLSSRRATSPPDATLGLTLTI